MIAFEQLLRGAAQRLGVRTDRIQSTGAELDDDQRRKSWPRYISAAPPFTAVMGL